MRFFHKTDFDFVGKRKIFVYVSLALNILGILGTIIVKPQFGIDFSGGNEIAIKFDKTVQTQDIRNAFEKKGHEAEIKSFGGDNQFLIRTKMSENTQDVIDKILKSNFEGNNFTVLKVDQIGAKIGEEMKSQAFLAVLFAVIAILLYVAFRFEFIYGMGAIIALIHDVIITFTGIVLFNKLGIINLEINQSILAAMLTVVGFSINDTVIIFDRIRENKESHKSLSIENLINLSVNETLSRTINTVLTVVLVLLTIVLFGGPVLQGFAFTMLIGIIIGTYSSIYVASSTVIWYMEKFTDHNVSHGKKYITA